MRTTPAPFKTLLFLLTLLTFVTGCAPKDASNDAAAPIPELLGSMPLEFATEFRVERYAGGYARVHVVDDRDYVLVPEGSPRTDLGVPGATIVTVPCRDLYVAGSAAADMLLRLDALDRIACCSTSPENFASEKVRAALESGAIRYVGKYSAPEYETLMARGCKTAIESTMVYHTPKVREQLERLGTAVVIERSNYENHPLGRLEWIKLYGLLLGKEEEAAAFFEREKGKVEALAASLDGTAPEKRKRVAFFYVSSNGYVNVRKPGDYLCRMIELAGGRYALDALELDASSVSALSTVNVDWEAFYQLAVDADVLIYNGSIGGGMTSLDDLFAKNELFRNFKAVKTGNVWSTSLDLYQESGRIADAIVEFKAAIDGDDSRPTELIKRLK